MKFFVLVEKFGREVALVFRMKDQSVLMFLIAPYVVGQRLYFNDYAGRILSLFYKPACRRQVRLLPTIDPGTVFFSLVRPLLI